ncbi:MAG: GNAT family N-acetyltransferase [Candidatus Rokuibacteriota bacterium]
MIRHYEPGRDRHQLRSCIAHLQEFERDLEPRLPRGEEMADVYLAFVLDRCEKTAGRIIVAEVDGAVVGFVSVLATVAPEEPDEGKAPYAYISDLVVLPPYRRRGLGRALLEHAERFARDSGATVLRVGVLAKNEGAKRLYDRMGFADYMIQLIKPLR